MPKNTKSTATKVVSKVATKATSKPAAKSGTKAVTKAVAKAVAKAKASSKVATSTEDFAYADLHQHRPLGILGGCTGSRRRQRQEVGKGRSTHDEQQVNLKPRNGDRFGKNSLGSIGRGTGQPAGQGRHRGVLSLNRLPIRTISMSHPSTQQLGRNIRSVDGMGRTP